MTYNLRRDDLIRTSGLFVPNEARYRAALHPERGPKLKIFLYPANFHPQIFIVPQTTLIPFFYKIGPYTPKCKRKLVADRFFRDAQ